MQATYGSDQGMQSRSRTRQVSPVHDKLRRSDRPHHAGICTPCTVWRNESSKRTMPIARLCRISSLIPDTALCRHPCCRLPTVAIRPSVYVHAGTITRQAAYAYSHSSSASVLSHLTDKESATSSRTRGFLSALHPNTCRRGGSWTTSSPTCTRSNEC
jgi:hypothetical protein